MAMQFGRRNLGKCFAASRIPLPSGFGAASLAARARAGGGGSGVAMTPASARHFYSGSSAIKELQELLAEFKELSFSDYVKLTIGTTVCASSTYRALKSLKTFCSRMVANWTFGDMRGGGANGRDTVGSSVDGV